MKPCSTGNLQLVFDVIKCTCVYCSWLCNINKIVLLTELPHQVEVEYLLRVYFMFVLNLVVVGGAIMHHTRHACFLLLYFYLCIFP